MSVGTDVVVSQIFSLSNNAKLNKGTRMLLMGIGACGNDMFLAFCFYSHLFRVVTPEFLIFIREFFSSPLSVIALWIIRSQSNLFATCLWRRHQSSSASLKHKENTTSLFPIPSLSLIMARLSSVVSSSKT